MVLEKQDSGICLSIEPHDGLLTSSTADISPSEVTWSRSRSNRGTVSGSADGLPFLKSGDKRTTEETEKDGKEKLQYSMETTFRGMRLSETAPNLSEGRRRMESRDENGDDWRMDSGIATNRCHHRLLLSEEEIENGQRTCQLCRKKEERLAALRRAIGDDPEPEEELMQSSSSSRMVKPNSPRDAWSPSYETPSSPTDFDHGQYQQSDTWVSSPRLTSSEVNGQSNGQKRLAPPSSYDSPSGQSSVMQSGRASPSPHQSSSGQQQALLQKLQGALSKVSPRIFKSTKAERPLSAVGIQDQKILALMLAKKEEEERQRTLRELAHREWEEEMRATKEGGSGTDHMNTRGSSFRRRRHTGDHGALTRRKDKSSAGEINPENRGGSGDGGGGGSDPQTPCSAHGTTRPASALDLRDASGGPENLDKGRRLSKSRIDERQQKSMEKQIQAMERKKSVEQRLEQHRREMEEQKQQLIRKQEHDLERANSIRMSREQQQMLKTKLKNLEAQQKQERINQMKRQSMIDLSQRQDQIQNRLTKAEFKHQQVKQDDARRRKDELERKIEQSRLRQEHIEAEQRQWQEQLLKYQKWKDYQADGLTRENLAKKREAACAERIQREKLQRDNMKRLLSQEEKWLNDVEATIAMKDARIRTVQKEKEEQIQRSRAMASASQRMREELKLHYSMNDLDQVTRKVVLENRLASKGGGCPNDTTTNNRFTSPPS